MSGWCRVCGRAHLRRSSVGYSQSSTNRTGRVRRGVVAVLAVFLVAQGAGAEPGSPASSLASGGSRDRLLTSASRPYLVADPRAGTLVAWDNLDLGRGTLSTASYPAGGVTPGIVRVARAPAGQRSYELTVTKRAHASPARGSDSVYLWNFSQPWDGLRSAAPRTWYRVRVYFPSRRYLPTTGEWNWFVEHHNDEGGTPFSCSKEQANIAWDIVTDFPVKPGQIGRHPRLKLRVMGGPTCSPATRWFDFGELRMNRWYDLLYAVAWQPRHGSVTVWINGVRRVVYRGPTLYVRPNGGISSTNLDLTNYRLHASWSSTIYFSRVLAGPTRASVR
jgi:hypothetical protein